MLRVSRVFLFMRCLVHVSSINLYSDEKDICILLKNDIRLFPGTLFYLLQEQTCTAQYNMGPVGD